MRLNKNGKVSFSIVGFGGRSRAYLNSLINNFKDKIEIKAVCEPDKAKQQELITAYGVKEENIYDYDYQLFDKPRMSDVIIIGTLDHLHYQEVVKFLEKGYDIILEKPIGTSLEEVLKISKEASKYPNQLVAVCHVLRHTKLFNTIKEIIDSNELGEVVDIQHNENIGYYHFAHSYVRGPWRDSKKSSPIIVAKSCHDMDILLYLLGDKHAVKISSFGDNKIFNKKNYTNEMSPYCVDCKIEKTCPYSAIKIYGSKKIKSAVFDLSSVEKIKENLGNSPYGRCVYNCDNDVCDNQVTIIEFTDGVHATFNMSAFTPKINRSIKVMCRYGEIRALEKPYVIETTNFKTGETKIYDLKIKEGGHGGGDEQFIINFMETYMNNKAFNSTLQMSIESHVMAYLAEESRVNNRVINIEERMKEIM